MSNLSLYDLAILNRVDTYTGLIEDVTTMPAEWGTFSAHARPETWYKTVKRTTLPTVQFRNANAGVAQSKSVFKQEVKEMFFVDGQIQIDEAIWDADPENVGSIWMIEARGIMQSAAILVGQQTWYGTSADASGFTGIRSQLAYTVAAGGTTNSTSAYLCWMDAQQGCRYDVGRNGQFELTPPRIQTVTDPANSGKVFTAYVGNLKAWIGMNVMSNLSAWAVTGITTHQTAGLLDQQLSDDRAEQLFAQIPQARRNQLRWFMNRTAISTLRRSRTSITPTTGVAYQNVGSTGAPAFAPMPDMLEGFPITVSDSVLNTETNS